MEGDDESWRDIDPTPLLSAAELRPAPRVKRIKIEPDIKVEPEIEAQGLDFEQPPEPSSPSSSEVSCPPSPDASLPPSPAASCSSPPEVSCLSSPEDSGASSPAPPDIKLEEAEDEHTPEASCDSTPESSHIKVEEVEDEHTQEAPCDSPPESSCPSSPEDSHASSPKLPDIKVEGEEDEHTPEAACESSPESSCPPSPEPPEIKTEVIDPPKCRNCKKPAVLKYTSYLNEHNADRPYFVCPDTEGWICWADQMGINALNPSCYCRGMAASRLDIIVRNKMKFGRGFWTCAKGQCGFYSENEDGQPGVSFEGGFYPRGRDGKRKYCD